MFSIVIAAAAATLTPMTAAERAQLMEDAYATGMTARIRPVVSSKPKMATPARAPKLKIQFLETMLKNKAR